MDDYRDKVTSFISQYPDGRKALSELLEAQELKGSWTFNEVDIDSGLFGEIVDRGIVEKISEREYQLTDPESVQLVLGGENHETNEQSYSGSLPTGLSFSPATRYKVPSLVIGLGLVVVFRVISFPSVFRGELVVLSANDPYYYRYWVDQLIVQSNDIFHYDVLVEPPLAEGEPLLVVTLWWFTALFGGDLTTGGFILAWYPVVAALITGLIVYLVGSLIFHNHEVGLGAVVMFALVPVHGFRTSLGFADHHAFDYIWLALTLLALVQITRPREDWNFQSWRVWSGVLVLSIALIGQILAWDASPIILGSLGLYLAVRVLYDVRNGNSPITRNMPILIAILIGGMIIHLVHTRMGWHSDQVAYAPVLILISGACLIIVAEFIHRISLPAWILLSLEVIGIYTGWKIFRSFLPEYADTLHQRLLILLSDREIAEMAGLFNQEVGSLFGPILLFGFVIALGLPYLAWFTRKSVSDNRPDLFVAIVYGWYFFLLGILQIRFTGELSFIIAVFAGFGLINLVRKIRDSDKPRWSNVETFRKSPDSLFLSKSGLISIVLLVLLIGSMSLIQIPVKTQQLSVGNGEYNTMIWMRNNSEEIGRSYPENYVFSRWDKSRMYNYFINGESQSYSFAQSNYEKFLASNDDEAWFGRLTGRTGYIVIEESAQFSNFPENSLYKRFITNYGAGDAQINGFGKYRVIYANEKAGFLVVKPIEGAVITGTGTPNKSINVTTRVTIHDTEFTFHRRSSIDASGNFSITIPYPGEYKVGESNMYVTEDAVMNGSKIQVGSVG